MRAVTSADDVEPRVQEVIGLPVLDLAAVQGEDPDLVSIKELLRDHDVSPPPPPVYGSRGICRGEDNVDSVSPAEGPGKCLYIAGEKKQQSTPDGKWWPLNPSDPRSSKLATTMPWLLIRDW